MVKHYENALDELNISCETGNLMILYSINDTEYFVEIYKTWKQKYISASLILCIIFPVGEVTRFEALSCYMIFCHELEIKLKTIRENVLRKMNLIIQF